MGAVEPTLQLQGRNFVSSRQEQGLLRPTLSPSNAVIHKRVKVSMSYQAKISCCIVVVVLCP